MVQENLSTFIKVQSSLCLALRANYEKVQYGQFETLRDCEKLLSKFVTETYNFESFMINVWALCLGAGISLRFRDKFFLSLFLQFRWFIQQKLSSNLLFYRASTRVCDLKDTDQTNMKVSFGSSDSAFPKSGPGCSKNGQRKPTVLISAQCIIPLLSSYSKINFGFNLFISFFSHEMLECPHNTYKDYIGFASSCKPCPVNSGHNLLGSHIFSDCKCLKGYSGDPMQDIPCTSKREVCSLQTFILSVFSPHLYFRSPGNYLPVSPFDNDVITFTS